MNLNNLKQFLNLEIVDILSVGFIERGINSVQYVKIFDQIFLVTDLGYTQVKQVDKTNGVYLQFKTMKTISFDFVIEEEDEFCCSSVSHLLFGSYLSEFVIRDLIIFGNHYTENDIFYCEAVEIDCVAGRLNRKIFIDSYDLDGLMVGNYNKQNWIEDRNYLNKPISSKSILD